MIYENTVPVGKLKIGDKVKFADFCNQPEGATWEVKTILYSKTGRVKINGGRALKGTTSIYE